MGVKRAQKFEDLMDGSAGTELERAFATQIIQAGLPIPAVEFVFHSTRLWRLDFAWAEPKIAVELEGGSWAGGRHVTGKGFRDDCAKLAEAAIAGFTVVRFTTDQVNDGIAIEMVERLFAARKPLRQCVQIPNYAKG